MTIHDIWIFTKSGGLCLYHKGYGNVQVDEYLFSGFLSAINAMAETELNQKGIESINMGDYTFLYEHFCGIVFTVAGDPIESSTALRKFVVNVRKEFINQFQDAAWEHFLNKVTKDGALEPYQTFEKTLDQLIKNYNEEKIKILNKKRILLELYSSLNNTFIEKVTAVTKLLHENFEIYLSKGIRNLIKNNEELKKIEVIESGLSFDFINLENIGLDELKTSLHDIFEGIVNTAYEVLGDKPINKIIPELYPILAKKLSEIDELKVSYPLLRSLVYFFYFHSV